MAEPWRTKVLRQVRLLQRSSASMLMQMGEKDEGKRTLELGPSRVKIHSKSLVPVHRRHREGYNALDRIPTTVGTDPAVSTM
jgi:hypothetical protein